MWNVFSVPTSLHGFSLIGVSLPHLKLYIPAQVWQPAKEAYSIILLWSCDMSVPVLTCSLVWPCKLSTWLVIIERRTKIKTCYEISQFKNPLLYAKECNMVKKSSLALMRELPGYVHCWYHLIESISSFTLQIITKATSSKMASNITVQSVLAEISQDHLECPICSGRFKQPKLLECSHSFCLECLQQLRQNSQSTTSLSCPVCRKETLLKETGIDGLKTDFKTISLIEAIETKETQLKQLQGKPVPSQEFVSKCSKHTGKDLVLYCETCKKLICTTCIAKDHRTHPVIELSDIWTRFNMI